LNRGIGGEAGLSKTKRINLALQGGGAHGAFTWGVLDHLLEQDKIEIGWVSATSAGAINAVALASGYAEGGRPGAQAKLRQVWEAIHKAAVPDFIRLNPFVASFSSLSQVAGMSRMFSPYDFNPMGFDPLRRLLAETIDFDRMRAASPIELMIAATDVATGRPRFFRRDEITVDAVLASACLPTLHHAVEIDGCAYWDGGFSANPDLVRLALESPVGDTLIVLLAATNKPGIPNSAPEIAGATNRLTFNAPLIRDIEIIEAVREAEGGWLQRRFRRPTRLSPLAQHRYHLIEAGRHTSGLSADSKMKPDWGLFTYLHGAGRTEAYKWLDDARASIGRQGTVDLKARFLAELPRYAIPVATVAAAGAGPVAIEAPPGSEGTAPSKPGTGGSGAVGSLPR
jgi:NTE family protein